MEEGRSRFDEHMPIFSPPSIFQKIIAELVGTYILIFAGCGSALVDRDHPLWGLVLVALIYALGHVSGARFNPAVTIAFATVAQFPLVQVPIYVAAFFSQESKDNKMQTPRGSTMNYRNIAK